MNAPRHAALLTLLCRPQAARSPFRSLCNLCTNPSKNRKGQHPTKRGTAQTKRLLCPYGFTRCSANSSVAVRCYHYNTELVFCQAKSTRFSDEKIFHHKILCRPREISTTYPRYSRRMRRSSAALPTALPPPKTTAICGSPAICASICNLFAI